MFEFEKVLHILTQEEKILLLVSEKELACTKLENFEFPVLSSLNPDEITINDGLKLPTISQLAQTMNKEKVTNYAKELAALCRKKNLNASFNAPFLFSEDNFLNQELTYAFAKGIADSNYPVILGPIPKGSIKEKDYRNSWNQFAETLKGSNLFAISFDGVEFNTLLDGYQGLRMAHAYNPYELVKSIYEGNLINTYTGFDGLEAVKDALAQYEEDVKLLRHREINRALFDEHQRKGVSLDPNILTQRVNELLSYLRDYDLMLKREYQFSEQQLYNRSRDIALASNVLIKNNNVLPLLKEERVGLVGPILDFFGGTDIFKDFRCKISGYTQGYGEGITYHEGYSAVKNLASMSDILLIFLGTIESEVELSEKQKEFIRYLDRIDCKKVFVVSSNHNIPLNFTDFCDGCVFVGNPYLGLKEVLAEQLYGYQSFNGRLAYDNYKFRLGYGLSYSNVKYQNMIVKETGITVTAMNEGAYPVSPFLKVVLSKPNGDQVCVATLREELDIQEAKHLHAEFNQHTFETFNEKYQTFEVLSGVYKIALVDPNTDEEIGMKHIEIQRNQANGIYINEVKENNSLSEFRETAIQVQKEQEKRGLTFGTHLFLTLLLGIYGLGLFSYLLYYGFSIGDLLIVILFGVFDGLTLIAFIISLVLAIKKKVRKPKLSSEEEAIEKFIQMESFDIKSQDYFIPEEPEEMVEEIEEPIEEVIEETAQEEEVVEEVVEIKPQTEEEIEINPEDVLDEEFTEDDLEFENIEVNTDEHTEFVNYADFSLLQKSFTDYCAYRGLLIDPQSAREFLGSLFATHFMILQTSDETLNDLFLNVVNDFLGNQDLFYVLDKDYRTEKQLLWQRLEDEGKYRDTDFSLYLKKVASLKDHLGIVYAKDLTLEELNHAYKTIVKKSGANNLTIKLCNGFKVPNNLLTIITPKNADYLEHIPSNMQEASINVEVILRRNAIEVDEVIPSYSKYPDYLDELRINQNDFYIDEDEMKKIDDFVEAYHQYDPNFRVGNKLVLMMEKMSTVMLMNGAEADEVLDVCFKDIILKSLKQSKGYQAANGDKQITELMEKIFTSDAFSKTLRLLKKPQQIIE